MEHILLMFQCGKHQILPNSFWRVIFVNLSILCLFPKLNHCSGLLQFVPQRLHKLGASILRLCIAHIRISVMIWLCGASVHKYSERKWWIQVELFLNHIPTALESNHFQSPIYSSKGICQIMAHWNPSYGFCLHNAVNNSTKKCGTQYRLETKLIPIYTYLQYQWFFSIDTSRPSHLVFSFALYVRPGVL